MPRVLVCGKGGTGKTVFSILLARALRELGYDVYILDMDESNELISSLLGVDQPEPLVNLFGGRAGLSAQLKQSGESGILKAIQELTKSTLELSSIPEPYVRTSPEGVKLLVVGKIRRLAEGCACPLNTLSKLLMKSIKLRDREFLVVDTDAGIEHVGRGVEETCDEVIVIADPTRESLVLARHMYDVCKSISKKFRLVINKATPDIEQVLRNLAENLGLHIDCVVPFDEKVFRSCMLGHRLEADTAYKAVKEFAQRLYA